MERLGPQDASFLYMEKPAVHQHVGGLAILDPSSRPDGTLSHETLLRVVPSRCHLVPRSGQDALGPLAGVARPGREGDAACDVALRVRRAALPSARRLLELGDYVQRLFSRPLDQIELPQGLGP